MRERRVPPLYSIVIGYSGVGGLRRLGLCTSNQDWLSKESENSPAYCSTRQNRLQVELRRQFEPGGGRAIVTPRMRIYQARD